MPPQGTIFNIHTSFVLLNSLIISFTVKVKRFTSSLPFVASYLRDLLILDDWYKA